MLGNLNATGIGIYEAIHVNGTLLVMFIPPILLMNGLIIVAFLYHEKLREVLTNYFVCSYACCNFMIGSVLIPIILLGKQKVVGGTVMYTVMVSVFTLSLCTYDRYWEVMKPSRYSAIMTKINVMIMLSFSWIFPILVAALPSIWLARSFDVHSKPQRLYLGVIAFSIILMASLSVVAHFVIFHVGKKKLSRILITEHHDEFHVRRKKIVQGVRFTKLYAFLSMSFLVFWLPTGYINLIDDVFMLNKCVPPQWFINLSFYWFLLSNIVNPVIYGLFQRRFRRVIIRSLKWVPGFRGNGYRKLSSHLIPQIVPSVTVRLSDIKLSESL